MDFFFNPRGIAVVGASPDRTGKFLLGNAMLNPTAPVFPVNPKYQQLAGLTCYASVRDIPQPVDLALLLVPARLTLGVLEDCAAKGVRGVMIQSAGYAEVGPEGRALQAKCVALARKKGMRLWGPNCMGLVDVLHKRYFTFMHPDITSILLPHGGLSLVVQSGMLSAGFLADLATRRGIAVSKACSIGNKCDVDECDVLEYLLQDPDSKAVALYLESLPRGRRFLELAERADKPLVMLKSGRSQFGARAALSHTASLAGDARLTAGLLQAAGIGIARDFHQLAEWGRTLALMPDLPVQPRFAILTFSGGGGILGCDLLEDLGLPVAQLSPSTLEALAGIFPDWMPVSNPVDLWPAMERHGPAQVLEQAVGMVVQDPGVDVLLIQSFLGGLHQQADLAKLKGLADAAGKVIAFWALGLDGSIKQFEQAALAHRVPVYNELARAMESLAVAARFTPRGDLPPRPAPSGRALPGDLPPAQGVWDEHQSKRLLAAWDIPCVEERLVESPAQAQEAAGQWGWPLVLKGLLPGEVHKTEKGLVALGLSSPSEVEAAWRRLDQAMEGKGQILAQRQMKPDYELIVGYLRDPQFGPCVMLGMGGVLAELEPDVAFDLAPLDPGRARALAGRLRASRLMKGFRGYAPLDLEALSRLICALGDLGASHSRISQIDINPVAVVAGRPLALDASLIWEDQS